jgi:DNA-directed RNA polymerase subunit RPC12/RpoP
MIDIIRLAFRLAEAVTGFAGRARQLYYAVVLMGHECPECVGKLTMLSEGRCCCGNCGKHFDPTAAFQTCRTCGGRLELRVRRYRCAACGADVASRFLFDGLAFDAEYFRQKMTESRQRKRELRERVRKMLAESRSPHLDVMPADLAAIPDLMEALSGLVWGTNEAVPWQPGTGFDLKRYQSHVEAHIRDFPVCLDAIPPLDDPPRKDRVWRFVAIIFMAHAGLVDVWQDGPTIMVMRHEANREGQDVPGDLEDVDGIEGPLGRAEA